MRKQKVTSQTLVTSLILLIVVSILVFSFYFKNNSENNDSPPASTDLVATPTAQSKIPSDTKPTSIANLLSTTDWAEARNNTFSIRYPEDRYEPNVTDKGIGLKIKGINSYGPAFSVADNYTGGSRRDWYLKYYSYSQADIGKTVFFTEKIVGPYSVLEVAAPKSTDLREILVAKGTILIDVLIQDADLQVVETIASTLKFNK